MDATLVLLMTVLVVGLPLALWAIVMAYPEKAVLLNLERSYMNTNFTYHLYVNNVSAVGTHVLADFNEINTSGNPQDTGYSALATPTFGSAFLNGSNQAEMDGTTWVTTFTYSGGTNFSVYGYFVKDTATGSLAYFEPIGTFAVPNAFLVSGAGLTYTVPIKWIKDNY